jgi:hypothetical protein
VPVGEQVYNLAFGFVTPLQTDDTSSWHVSLD